jgi:hypothetical protein
VDGDNIALVRDRNRERVLGDPVVQLSSRILLGVYRVIRLCLGCQMKLS